MPLLPLFGHQPLREQLLATLRAGRLPQSLLLHGPPGVGKQRLALWLGQALLCEAEPKPCGVCRHCRYALDLVHPDLTWVFPRPRLKDADADLDDVKNDLALAAKQRADAHGLYAATTGSEGIFVTSIRFLVRQASMTPALARRKVFVIGDGDRMVPQEGSEYAANALLKLLEEPPDDTYIIMTTSALAGLLPTIRSRVIAVRVPRLASSDVQEFLAEPLVLQALDKLGLPKSEQARISLASGAPGVLISSAIRQSALDEARRMLDAAAGGKRVELLRLAIVQGNRGARGAYSEILDALTVALHERMRAGAEQADDRRAASASRAIDLVEDAKLLADGNVNPQLITAKLLHDLSGTLA